jgi:hypothetical protein
MMNLMEVDSFGQNYLKVHIGMMGPSNRPVKSWLEVLSGAHLRGCAGSLYDLLSCRILIIPSASRPPANPKNEAGSGES